MEQERKRWELEDQRRREEWQRADRERWVREQLSDYMDFVADARKIGWLDFNYRSNGEDYPAHEIMLGMEPETTADTGNWQWACKDCRSKPI
jgi:hypothetical protein